MSPIAPAAGPVLEDVDQGPRWDARDNLEAAAQNVVIAVNEFVVRRVDAGTVREVVSELLDELAAVPEETQTKKR